MENALKQYIELYRQHSGMVSRHAPEVMNALRDEALTILEDNGLPAKGSENYEVTDLPGILAPDYGLNINRLPLDVNPAASFRCGVPHLSTSLFFLINDMFAQSSSSRSEIQEGVEVGSLASCLNEDEAGKKFYGKIADIANPIVALNTLFAQDGLFIRIKKGVKLKKPLQLVSILQNSLPLMAVRRILIIVEENAEGQLLVCDHTQNPDIDMMSLQVIEIVAQSGSRFDIYDLEESSRKTSRLSALYLHQEKDSNVLIDGMTLFNGVTRNEYHTVFRGENAELKLLGMGVETGNSFLSNYSFINHSVGHCFTDELFKYIVEDEAVGAFVGTIYVAPGAVKTEAFQTNRNMVTSPSARMFSKPQLEIYNDDVKCSHGSATGQLDAMQLFYMRSRGLSEEEANLLLKQAFMADVIDGVRIPMLRDRLVSLVEKRFVGESVMCADCDICPAPKPTV